MKKILIALLLVAFTYQTSFSQQDVKEITVEDLWVKYTFWASGVFGLRSMNDGLNYTTYDRQHNAIVKYSYKTGEATDTILKINDLKLEDFSDYHFSADETKLLLETNVQSIYRHSYTAENYIYDINTKKLSPLSDKKEQQLATFSPEGSKVAFAYQNNIYIKDLISDKETQVSTDGKKNHVLNGVPDWVYEEEFGFSKAFDWSADGNKLAYIRFDESKVKTFDMTVYAGLAPKLEQNKLYPENRQWKYPKAGDDNSVISVHIFDLKTNKTLKADIGTETDIYIPRIKWTTDANQLIILRLNRLQNHLEILFADAATGKTKVIYNEKNKYYIETDMFDNITFLEDGENFIYTSEKDGYNHIYYRSIDGKTEVQVTNGKWEVMDFSGYDEKAKLFYYTAAEASPLVRDLYVTDLKGKKKKKLSTEEGTNRADFSKGFKYYINTFSSINKPTYVTLHNSKGEQIRVLKDNDGLAEQVKQYGGVNKSFFKFKTSEGVELNGYMIKPHDFDANKKYPVLMYQYSGPNSQSVQNRWSFGWDQLLAQKGYIVACVDGRGTGARGEAFRKITYQQLGKYETVDQIEAAKYLGSLAYVDAKRIGIWGWSFGGYETLLALTKGADYFKAGIAVAPVTNWRYYDNIYTERYMRKPQDNAGGYDDNSPINHVEKLQGKLLLVHGTADDNVHVQNSMEMSEALVQAGKQFRQFYYTNRNHGIYGGYTRYHLYTMMTNFILENL
jgi:dipeptidyl-peptidase-4